MKAITPFLFLLLIPNYGFSQEVQETELDRRNGFKDIKMASPIDSVKGAIFKKDFKEKGHHDAKLYTIEHPDYQFIGEVKIESIEVKTFKGLIYEISVITVKDSRLMKGMEAALGKPIYNVRDESYNWAGKNLGLKFRPHKKNQLELLYGSKVVHQLMKDDKANKIKDISGDF
ncbi:MAG TPA: hypothetical protein VFU05_13905 [Cyclobacteriaceae bacterium]|nr:hypothetical protein [Cyclobacteriaceae bacterium]